MSTKRITISLIVQRMRWPFLLLLFVVCMAVMLGVSVRGIAGNPTHETLNTDQWKDEGPLELSPDRGRFALTFSLMEDKSFSFALPVARFATPDLGYKDGKYVSLFAPGVSFVVIPGYILGKMVGLSQVGTFATIAVFALFNALLVAAIARRLNATRAASVLFGFLFLFATPAYAYAVTLYQHHITTFLLLLSIYILVAAKSRWWLSIVFAACAFSISVDYPNAFFFFPVGLMAVGKLFMVQTGRSQVRIRLPLKYLLTCFAVIIPLAFFLWSNYRSYGDPFQLSGTVGGVRAIDEAGNPTVPDAHTTGDVSGLINPDLQQKSVTRFFKTRDLPKGLYTQFFSVDRGTLVYAPIVLIGIIGVLLLLKTHEQAGKLLVAVIAANILLYAMWGDPYGGWAFGLRYLIPTYALLSIGSAITLTRFGKNIVVLFLCIPVAMYSLSVNTIGALTSNRNPPKVEILALEAVSGRRERYTFTRNMEMLDNNHSKSFVYQTYLADTLTAWQYTSLVIGTLSTMAIVLFILHRVELSKAHHG